MTRSELIAWAASNSCKLDCRKFLKDFDAMWPNWANPEFRKGFKVVVGKTLAVWSGMTRQFHVIPLPETKS